MKRIHYLLMSLLFTFTVLFATGCTNRQDTEPTKASTQAPTQATKPEAQSTQASTEKMTEAPKTTEAVVDSTKQQTEENKQNRGIIGDMGEDLSRAANDAGRGMDHVMDQIGEGLHDIGNGLYNGNVYDNSRNNARDNNQSDMAAETGDVMMVWPMMTSLITSLGAFVILNDSRNKRR